MPWEFKIETANGRIVGVDRYNSPMKKNEIKLEFQDEFSNPVIFNSKGQKIQPTDSQFRGSRQAAYYRQQAKGVLIQRLVAACVWCVSHPKSKIPKIANGGGALHFNGNSDDNHLANLLFIDDAHVNSKDTLYEGFMAMVYDVLKHNGAGKIDFSDQKLFEQSYQKAFVSARNVVAHNLNNGFLSHYFWNSGPFKSAFEHMIISGGHWNNGIIIPHTQKNKDRFTIYMDQP